MLLMNPQPLLLFTFDTSRIPPQNSPIYLLSRWISSIVRSHLTHFQNLTVTEHPANSITFPPKHRWSMMIVWSLPWCSSYSFKPSWLTSGTCSPTWWCDQGLGFILSTLAQDSIHQWLTAAPNPHKWTSKLHALPTIFIRSSNSLQFYAMFSGTLYLTLTTMFLFLYT